MNRTLALLTANHTWGDNEKLWVYKSNGGEWVVRPGKPSYYRSSVSFKTYNQAIKFATERPWIAYRHFGYFEGMDV